MENTVSRVGKVKRTRSRVFGEAVCAKSDGPNNACRAREQLEEQIAGVTRGQRGYICSAFKELAEHSPKNARVLCSYIIAEQNEINIKDSTKDWKIKVIFWLSKHFGHGKLYSEMEKQDILLYLNSLRKSPEEDPDERWIGTYNNRILAFNKFFRWLYTPGESDFRKRPTPDCMKGVKRLWKRRKSSYKPSDMWTKQEHAVFLKHCPSARDRCYHSMAIDTSARPHELLALKIGDIQFKVSGTGAHYGQITVSGKTGQRTLPLIDCVPYVKEWIAAHPISNNPEAPLFVALADENFGQQLTVNGIREKYQYQCKKELFPRLLRDHTIPEADRELIGKMLQKPWNPYVLRHSSLTETSKILNEQMLRNHAGWTVGSKMPQTYLHYYGAESANVLLEKRGIIGGDSQSDSDPLRARQCPNCSEPNRPDAKFCGECQMVLIYDAYSQTVQNEKASMQRIDNLEQELVEIREILRHPEILDKVTRAEQYQSS